MLVDDMLKLRNGNATERERIVNKYKAELVYYAVIESVVEQYGSKHTSKMSDVTQEALGFARDQMALLASDQNLVSFDENGGMKSFNAIQLIENSFRNSESLRKMISTYLASNEYKDQKLTDDEMYDLTTKEIEKISQVSSDHDTLGSRVFRMYRQFDLAYDESQVKIADETEKYRMYYKDSTDTNRGHLALKISPLIPEVRLIRNTIMNPVKNKDNGLLEYDAKYGHFGYPYSRIKGALDKLSAYSNQYDIFDYNRDCADLKDEQKRFMQEQMLYGVQHMMAWKMMHIVDQYSEQSLTDKDVRIITDMFAPNTLNNQMMFGKIDFTNAVTFKESYEELLKTADDYFDYIEDVCKSTREEMSSHEFEIHFDQVDSQRTSVKHMYFTGESMASSSKTKAAVKNPTRYFDVVLHSRTNGNTPTMDNAGNQFIIGDIVPANIDSYAVSNRNVRKDWKSFATYQNVVMIDRTMIQNMRDLYHSYHDKSAYANMIEMDIVKPDHRIGAINKMADDITDYMKNGKPNMEKIVGALIADREQIKVAKKDLFTDEYVVKYFGNVMATYLLDKDNHQTKTQGNIIANLIDHNGDLNRKEMEKFHYDLNRSLVKVLNAQTGYTSKDVPILKHIMNVYIDRYLDALPEWIKSTSPDDINFQNTLNLVDAEKCIDDSLDTIFGTGGLINSKNTYTKPYESVLIKPNACQHYTQSFTGPEYQNLINLLSYTDDVMFETNSQKSKSDVLSYLDEQHGRYRTHIALQLYSGYFGDESLDEDINYDDSVESADVENTDDEDNVTESSNLDNQDIFDDKILYSSLFAPVDLDNDLSYADLIKEYKSGSEDERETALYIAKNPLKYNCMQMVHEMMSESRPDYDPKNLKMTENGILYYRNKNKELAFKIGPIMDEKAYVRPLRIENEDGSVSVDHKVSVTNGKLDNEVVFGALDTSSLRGNENDIPYRFYGISAKIGSYDGYDHHNKKFIDRVSFNTYQTGVLDRLHECVQLYLIAEQSKQAIDDDIPNKERRENSLNAIFYTNVSSTSLRKCYSTNAFILEEKEKCRLADQYLTHVLDTDENAKFACLKEEDRNDPFVQEKLKDLANQVIMMQGQMYRNRVRMPGIRLEQNIACYNTALNLQQCEQGKATYEEIDTKSLRNSDCKSMRVAMFSPNAVFDSTLSGTAKQLGAIAFLTTDVKFDHMTGDLEVINDDPDARCILVADGIHDFETDEIVTRFNKYPGGQAVDRQQLSDNGNEKAILYQDHVRFALYNTGYNMEDGYVVSGRAAMKLGHFDKSGKYVADSLCDKLGDCENGNKGVTAKILSTTGLDIEDDVKAKNEFVYEYLENELKVFDFNHSGKQDKKYQQFREEFANELFNQCNLKGVLVQSIYEFESGTKNSEKQLTKYFEYLRQEAKDLDLFKEITTNTCDAMSYKKVMPFAANYDLELSLWQLQRDNPDVDVFLSPACIATRSNPSLLMYLSDNRDSDIADLKVRDENGELKTVKACGEYALYVDSHTAEDKNKLYANGNMGKAGRKYGGQEYYALDAKHCEEYFHEVTLKNDKSFDRRLDRFNRKCLMNGFVCDPYDDLKFKKLPEFFEDKNVEIEPITSDGIIQGSVSCPGYRFIDMESMASEFVNRFMSDVSPSIMKSYLTDLNKGEFGSIVYGSISRSNAKNVTDEVSASHDANDYIRRLFDMYITSEGGGFLVLPEGYSHYSIHHKIKEINADSYDTDYSDINSRYENNSSWDGDSELSDYGVDTDLLYGNKSYQKKYDGKAYSITGKIMSNDKERDVLPLFLDAVERVNEDGELVAGNGFFANVDDNAQFKIFKSVFARSVVQILNDKEKEGIVTLDSDVRSMISKVSDSLYNQIQDNYENAKTSNASLDMTDMRKWMKKNLLCTYFNNSATAVWAGDPTLDINEVGMSLELAENLGLVKYRKDIDVKAIKELSVEERFQKISEIYEPLTDDDLVLINRSPGQTTGCIRALQFRIDAPNGGSVRINPACATIFDGDFDGDTVGVINFKKIESSQVSKQDIELMVDEVQRTMTMDANLVHTADYTTIEDKNGEDIKFVNPLFIAGNADVAVAKYFMTEAYEECKKNAIGEPLISYNVNDRLDALTIRANIVEQYKQISYEMRNNVVCDGWTQDIIQARYDHIEELKRYNPDDTFVKNLEKDWYAATNDQSFNVIKKYEQKNREDLTSVYNDITGFMKNACYVDGNNDFEMLEKAINNSNILKKGKLPQLNALLSFSGVHEICEGGILSVAQDDKKKFKLMVRDPETNEKVESGKISAELRKKLCETIHIDYKKAVSDVPKSDFKTQIESNITAQSDKSDATGNGGVVAQKLQKILSPYGYSELGLRISGPITQMFLDAKQNVTVCEKNLTIGKFVMNSICNFEQIREFQPEFFDNCVPSQVRNGQFTIANKDERKGVYNKRKGTFEPGCEPQVMTVEGCVTQLDNFLKTMDLPELSPIDKTILSSCLTLAYSDEKGKVKNVLMKADEQGSVTYRLAYDSTNNTLNTINALADEKTPLYQSASFRNMEFAETQLISKHDEKYRENEVKLENQEYMFMACNQMQEKVINAFLETNNKLKPVVENKENEKSETKTVSQYKDEYDVDMDDLDDLFDEKPVVDEKPITDEKKVSSKEVLDHAKDEMDANSSNDLKGDPGKLPV